MRRGYVERDSMTASEKVRQDDAREMISSMEMEDASKRGGSLEWLAVSSVMTVSIFAGLLGYDIGVMSGALMPMSRDLSFTSSQEEIAVGCLNFVSAAGAISGGTMYNKLGAVKCVKIAVVLYAVGMLVIAASHSFAMVFLGRLIVGLGVGLGFAICPQYIAEISPPAWRGVLVSCFEISINLGLCGGYLANLRVRQPERLSQVARADAPAPRPHRAHAHPPNIPKLPESPRWLLRTPGNEALAGVLVRTCGEAAEGRQLADIKEIIAQQNAEEESQGDRGKKGWSQLFEEPVARRALLIGAGTAFFQQANGSEAAVYYVPQVLKAAGVESERDQLGAAAVVGLCKTVFITVGQFSVDRYGRRVMLLSSIAAVTASLWLLAYCLGAAQAGGSAAGLTLFALCFFMASFSLGMGPVTWVVASEIFPLRVRSRGVAFSMAANRITSGTVAMTFLSLSRWLGVGGAFSLFACVSASHFVFTYALLPETRGKTLEEIEAVLAAGSSRYQRFVDDEEVASSPTYEANRSGVPIRAS